jgi:hypothetical protein
MEHLHESTQKIIHHPSKERISYIMERRWIGYPKAIEIHKRMNELIDYPSSERPTNLLVVGDTGNGKTRLAKQFFYLNRPKILPDDINLEAKVIYMLAPTHPDERRFYNNLLTALNAPFKLTDNVDKKQFQAFSILRRIGTKMIIIDEIHNIMVGTTSKQRGFLTILRNLSNELQMVLVAVGIKEAFNAINADNQLSNRFERAILPRWKKGKDLDRLLASFEALIPLKKESNLADEVLSNLILSLSEGTIGEISKIIDLAAIEAINSGTECITPRIIKKLNYTPPSERKIFPKS